MQVRLPWVWWRLHVVAIALTPSPDRFMLGQNYGGKNVWHREGAAWPQAVHCLWSVVHDDFDQLL
jgi:hypothetical protein